MEEKAPLIVYCRCAYAQVVPTGVKDAVLGGLCQAEVGFEAVADLCEMAAHRDPRLAQITALAQSRPVRIAACYERAVRGLFTQAESPLPAEGITVANMRTESAENVLGQLLEPNQAATASAE
jgi:hypothetical protein